MRKDLADARKIRVRAVQAATFPALALTGGVAGWRGPGLLDARSELGRKRARPISAARLSVSMRDGNLGCAGSLERTRLPRIPC